MFVEYSKNKFACEVLDGQVVDDVEFLMIAQAHVVSFQFSMNLNHKQCSNTIVAVNQDHKKNNHAQDKRSYPRKTLLNQEKNPTTLCYIAKRRNPLHRKYGCQLLNLYAAARAILLEDGQVPRYV